MLRRWGDCARYCARYQREIREMQEMLDGAVSLKSPAYDGMPHGTGVTRPTERNAEMLERLEERYTERIRKLTAAIGEELDFAARIDKSIDILEPNERKVVEWMYKDRRSVTKISQTIAYDARTVWRIENRACEKIYETMKLSQNVTVRGID